MNVFFRSEFIIDYGKLHDLNHYEYFNQKCTCHMEFYEYQK